ncbi:MAG: hypothetical protein GX494_12055 [Clostridiaceae bacterium]|nr:hypothetical protein [Clostridiaceae bacterium]
MLDPNDRRLYLDELRPPVGYTFDRAVCTTYSLDLLSLLTVPLSLAFSETSGREEVFRDPIIVLEALQRTVERIAIFCQQGRIVVPQSDSLLYSYLEKSVVEVRPPSRHGVFHPKVWLLRFTSDDEPPLFRFVCLSRNLTSDQSWDTALTLEGHLDQSRKNAFSRNRPLSDFIAALLSLAVRQVNPNVQEHVSALADEVLRVRFEVPDGFDGEDWSFMPMGFERHSRTPTLDGYSRLMIISPFLSGEPVSLLARTGNNNVLISRSESLDALPPDLLADIRSHTQVYTVDDAAERPETEDEQLSHGKDLSGLHAKLFVAERGWNARLFTGSANATDAAFHNNVEFLVELSGRKSRIGINKILQKEGERGALLDMLVPYHPSSTVESTQQEKLESLLEQGRAAVAEAGLALRVVPESGGTFVLRLNTHSPLVLEPELVDTRCHPITINVSQSQSLSPLANGDEVDFCGLPLRSVTGFLAFRFTAEVQEVRQDLSFVMNLPVTGMPEERDREILRAIVADRGQFLRYLRLLLSDDPDAYILSSLRTRAVASDGGGTEPESSRVPDLPLFEDLVKTLSRSPEKLARISRLIEELRDTEGGISVLPEGFSELWSVIRVACTKEDDL